MKRPFRFLLAAVLCIVSLCGCRSSYYAAWETFGVYKRDLLKKKVVAARDGEKAASEQFKDALTRLKELYNFDGGKLEQTYSSLQKDYDRSNTKAEEVRKRIKEMETVAGDLFAEWETELKEISTPALRDSSRKTLQE